MVEKTDIERLTDYLVSNDEDKVLPPKLQQKLERVNFCDEQLRKLQTRKQVANMIMKRFDVGETKAYNIIAETQAIYGVAGNFNKEYSRIVLYEKVLQLAVKAEKAGDFKAAAALIDKAYKIAGLDKSDSGAPAMPLPVQINYVFDPTLLGAGRIDNLDQQIKSLLGKADEETTAEILP